MRGPASNVAHAAKFTQAREIYQNKIDDERDQPLAKFKRRPDQRESTRASNQLSRQLMLGRLLGEGPKINNVGCAAPRRQEIFLSHDDAGTTVADRHQQEQMIRQAPRGQGREQPSESLREERAQGEQQASKSGRASKMQASLEAKPRAPSGIENHSFVIDLDLTTGGAGGNLNNRNFDPYSVYGEEDEEEDVWYSEERLFEVSARSNSNSNPSSRYYCVLFTCRVFYFACPAHDTILVHQCL